MTKRKIDIWLVASVATYLLSVIGWAAYLLYRLRGQP